MDLEDKKYSLAELEKCPYRVLQQLSKSLLLPSNVKKMYLIEMIHAKKYKSEEEVQDIILRVKQERQQKAQAKKKQARKQSFLQGSEVSSTNNSLSPPIDITPKRPGHIVIRCSPENIREAIAKYNAKQNLAHNTSAKKTIPSPRKSDRVLRSRNIKKNINNNVYDDTFKPLRYNVQNSYTNPSSVLRPQDVFEKPEQRFPKANLNENCMVKTYKPVLNKNAFCLDPERRQIVQDRTPLGPVMRNAGTDPMVPAKRKRVLSGIYPIVQKEQPKVTYEYLHSVGFRRRDGKITKINALVQRRRRNEKPSSDVTVQDIINCNVTQSFNPKYVNQAKPAYTKPSDKNERANLNRRYGGKNIEQQNRYGMDFKDNGIGSNIEQAMYRDDVTNSEENSEEYIPEYYHKKIRSEVRSQRSSKSDSSTRDSVEDNLPKINDVFSRFNTRHDVTDPIYEQVNNHTEQKGREGVPSQTRQRDTVEDKLPKINDVFSRFNIRHDVTQPIYVQVNNNIYQSGAEDKLPKINDVFSGFNTRRDVTDPIYVRVNNNTEQIYQSGAEDRLPNINDAFSRFNNRRDVTDPIYVQVNNNTEQIPAPTTTSINLLETLYNFRTPFIVNQPLHPVATVAQTHCVYSSPLIASAVAQQSTRHAPQYALALRNVSPVCERDNYNSDLAAFPRIRELLKYGEEQDRRIYRCDEEISTASTFDDSASQELGATVTIPEMVEDALELISQDGDYMERIGMDVRVQCVICTFVCPKFMLEYHLRKEHSTEIHHQLTNSSNISLPLGGLLHTGRCTRVLSNDAALYVLTVYYEADFIYATIHTLLTDTNLPKSGSITIYNKVSGEPYSWEGEIPTLPHSPPHFPEGLRVEVSHLNLLPNSANLTLLNGELVLKSPTKVVVGQPELNDIHVILFVKIFN